LPCNALPRLATWHSTRYDPRMRKPLDELLAQALRLDPKDRAELASELLGSLDGPEDLDAQAAWEDEIQRRVAALEAGTLRLEPWEAVKIRIEKTLRKR